MISIEEIVNKEVSYQPFAWSQGIEKTMLLGDCIKEIKRGKYIDEITKLRAYIANGDNENYDAHKKRLPGVTFTAKFNAVRKREAIINYNSLVVIDIDKLDTQELVRIKQILKDDKFVFSYWLSPSGLGIKGLVAVNFDFEIQLQHIDIIHRQAFEKLAEYFQNQYTISLDKSGSDTTRLCFLSCDPVLVFKNEIIPFVVTELNTKTEQSKAEKLPKAVINYKGTLDTLNNPKGKNNQRDKRLLIQLINFLQKTNQSITSSYADWYRVAYALANSFTHDLSEKYFLELAKQDGIKFDEIESRNMLLYCYQNSKGSIKFKTILFLAQQRGFLIKRGSP